MSKSLFVVSLSTSEKPQFDELEEFELSQIIREEREIAALEAEITDRFAFEKDHPFEWSDYGFEASLSNFVFD